MSDDLRLPDELAAFEALLAAQPLPVLGINRDQLLYQAGWSACEAQRVQPRPSVGDRLESRERRRTAAWSLASAAVAASLAVTATLGWQASTTREEIERTGGEAPRLAVEEPAPESAPAIVPSVARSTRSFAEADVERLLNSPTTAGRPTLAGSWFTIQRRHGGATLNDLPLRTTTNDVSPTAPKSARELWHELTPDKPSRPAVWPWGATDSGDAI